MVLSGEDNELIQQILKFVLQKKTAEFRKFKFPRDLLKIVQSWTHDEHPFRLDGVVLHGFCLISAQNLELIFKEAQEAKSHLETIEKLFKTTVAELSTEIPELAEFVMSKKTLVQFTAEKGKITINDVTASDGWGKGMQEEIPNDDDLGTSSFLQMQFLQRWVESDGKMPLEYDTREDLEVPMELGLQQTSNEPRCTMTPLNLETASQSSIPGLLLSPNTCSTGQSTGHSTAVVSPNHMEIPAHPPILTINCETAPASVDSNPQFHQDSPRSFIVSPTRSQDEQIAPEVRADSPGEVDLFFDNDDEDRPFLDNLPLVVSQDVLMAIEIARRAPIASADALEVVRPASAEGSEDFHTPLADLPRSLESFIDVRKAQSATPEVFADVLEEYRTPEAIPRSPSLEGTPEDFPTQILGSESPRDTSMEVEDPEDSQSEQTLMNSLQNLELSMDSVEEGNFTPLATSTPKRGDSEPMACPILKKKRRLLIRDPKELMIKLSRPTDEELREETARNLVIARADCLEFIRKNCKCKNRHLKSPITKYTMEAEKKTKRRPFNRKVKGNPVSDSESDDEEYDNARYDVPEEPDELEDLEDFFKTFMDSKEDQKHLLEMESANLPQHQEAPEIQGKMDIPMNPASPESYYSAIDADFQERTPLSHQQHDFGFDDTDLGGGELLTFRGEIACAEAQIEDAIPVKSYEEIKQEMMEQVEASHPDPVAFSPMLRSICPDSTRKSAARAFYNMLTMAKAQTIEVVQEEPYGEILLKKNIQKD